MDEPGGNISKDEIVIRPLHSSDSMEELTELLHRAYKELADAGLEYGAAKQDAERTAQRVGQGQCWVAESDGRLVGTITFMDASQTKGFLGSRRTDVASFCQFAVEPRLQGSGIGSLLLNTVEHSAIESGAAELACNTASRAKRLIRMYLRRGYRAVGYVSWTGTNFYSLILSKDLRPGGSESGLVRIRRILRLYAGFVLCWTVRSNDGRLRLWGRVFRRMKSWMREGRN